MSAPAPFLSRHLGDYLLVAQLSEDPLGTVFRALYAADERRFVRLRVLQSEHLAPAAILEIARNDRLRDVLAHEAIVARPELDVVEGIPFMNWDETAGWTLDVMLSRVRAFGIRIPVEYALLIAERIAAALEHAHQTMVDGRPVAHGLLWPGFVSISQNAMVRVGGFGLAEAILPQLGVARLTSEIAPYVAPESRTDARPSPGADVYSLGAILIELVTGRRPSLETPSAEMRSSDPRSEELTQFLRRCLAAPGERFPDAVEAHRALQQMVTGDPFSLFTANLALFLYKLLNPESQTVAPSSDWESTSPVLVETKTRRDPRRGNAAPETGPPAAKERRVEARAEHGEGRTSTTNEARAGVRKILDSTATAAWTGSARRRRGDLEPREEEAAPREAAAAPEPSDPFPVPEPAPPEVREAVGLLIATAPEIAEPEPPAPEASPLDPALPPAPPPASSWSWRRPALLLAAAAGVITGVFLVAGRSRPVPEAVAPVPAPAAPATAAPLAPALPEPAPTPEPPAASGASPATSHPARAAKKPRPELRQPTEDLRYRAALARVEADRLRAKEAAPDIFEEGVRHEKEGLRLLRDRDYDAAQLAFSRAAQLFDEAREKTWEERVRDTSLTANRQ